jgi:hypothetical protein
MDDAPPPQPLTPLGEFQGRPISRKGLWGSLLVPSAVTLVAAALIGMGSDPSKGHSYGPPDVYLTLLWIGPLAALLCLAWFVSVLRARYRGGSLFFLSFAYLFGQVILQVAFGFCCCLGILSLYSR